MTDKHQPLRDALKAGPTSALYTHPRDDNMWMQNKAFATVCTPAAISALLADLDAVVGALEMVSNHYSASLDWQPPYVRASRAALSQIKAAGREQA